MHLIICMSLSLILGGSSAFAADASEPSPSKPTAMSRAAALATKLVATVKNLTDDVVPLVKTADEELARQWRAEWPAIQEEIREQLRAVVPGNKKADSAR